MEIFESVLELGLAERLRRFECFLFALSRLRSLSRRPDPATMNIWLGGMRSGLGPDRKFDWVARAFANSWSDRRLASCSLFRVVAACLWLFVFWIGFTGAICWAELCAVAYEAAARAGVGWGWSGLGPVCPAISVRYFTGR